MQIALIKLIKGTLLLIWIPLIGCYFIVISGYNAWKLITFLPVVYLCYMKNPVLCLGMNWNSDHVSIFKMIWKDFSFCNAPSCSCLPLHLTPHIHLSRADLRNWRKKRNLFTQADPIPFLELGHPNTPLDAAPASIAIWTETLFIKSDAMLAIWVLLDQFCIHN